MVSNATKNGTAHKNPAIRAIITSPLAPKEKRRTWGGGRKKWTPAMEESMIAKGVELRMADPNLKDLPLYRRAMEQAIPREDWKKTTALPRASYAWFRDGVDKGIDARNRVTPQPIPKPVPTPPPPVIEAPVASPAEKALELMAGLPNESLIAVLLARVFADRASDLKAIVGLMNDVKTLGERLAVVEGYGALTTRLLNRVLGQLDPSLMEEMPATKPVETVAAVVAAPPPPLVKPQAPAAPKKLRILAVGLRPDAATEVEKGVREFVEFTSDVLSGGGKYRRDMRGFDYIFLTRHTNHAIQSRAIREIGKDNVRFLGVTSARAVVDAIHEARQTHARKIREEVASRN